MSQQNQNRPVGRNWDEVEMEFVYLQSATSAPGLFGMETTLNQKTVPGAKFVMYPDFLIISKDDKHALVPAANIKLGVIKK